MTEILVVTHKRWFAEYLKLSSVIPIRHDYGFGPPEYLPGHTRLWCPGEFAAKLQAAGYDIPLPSVSPEYLELIHPQYLGRKVALTTWGEAKSGRNALFYKLAQAKSDEFPAQVGKPEWDLPEDEPIIISEPMDFHHEVRVLMLNGLAVDSSIYKMGHRLYPDIEGRDTKAESIANLACQVNFPHVLDIGFVEGRGYVIEANNVWSSNPYGLDPKVFCYALTVGHGKFEPTPLQKIPAESWKRYLTTSQG